MPRRQLALACLDFLDTEPETFVAAAAGAGFEAVTLRVAGSHEPVVADIGEDSRRRKRVLTALSATGLAVLDVEVLRLSERLSRDEIAGAVALAAECGARHLLVVNAALEPAAAVEKLGLIVVQARAAGVLPCLEPMVFTRCRNLAEAIAVAVPAGAGVLVDALHLHRCGDAAADVAAAAEVYGDALLPYLQLCDAPLAEPGDPRTEAMAERLLPGRGELDLAGLLAALPGRAVSVEAPTAATRGCSPFDRARATALSVAELDCLHQTATTVEGTP